MTPRLSPEGLTEELRRNLVAQGRLPPSYAPSLAPALLERLIAPGYAPGLGVRPFPTREEGIRKVAQWLYHEIDNRLDEPSPTLVASAVREAGALVSLDLTALSAPELRAALACALSGIGFPALNSRLAEHNARVDDLAVRTLLTTGGLSCARSLSAWLMLLAAANLLEVWPAAGEPETALAATRLAALRPGECRPFLPLAERLEARLRAGTTLGLVADNHGEAVIDLAFLAWVEKRWGVKTFLLAKACPVEIDLDDAAAECLRRRHFPEFAVRVPAGGARTPGNLLPLVDRASAEALFEIQAEGGLLLVKGIANLQTVPGILLEAIFLFAVKSPAVAETFGAAVGSPALDRL